MTCMLCGSLIIRQADGKWILASPSPVQTDPYCCTGHDLRGFLSAEQLEHVPRPPINDAEALEDWLR